MDIICQPHRASILSQCKKMAAISAEVRSPSDGDLPAILADEKRVRHLQNTVQSFMNPWTVTSDSLISLSSGRVASAELEKDFVEKQLHPMDLKQGLAKEINTLLEPVRKIMSDKEQLIKEAYPEN